MGRKEDASSFAACCCICRANGNSPSMSPRAGLTNEPKFGSCSSRRARMIIRAALLATLLLALAIDALAQAPVVFDERERKLILSLSPLLRAPRDTTNRADGN